ncbi:START-like domain superfamily [Sesbania bispinosa]|nr:START-like domain superfamily [Sesbania bispinosa]
MDFPSLTATGSGEEQDSHQSGKDERSFHRHASYQISKLEEMFKEYSHPDESRRLQLSEELGLEPRQVKFWFQNRRTKGKNISERMDNNALRIQNEKFRSENIVLRETLKGVLCLSCRRPTIREDHVPDHSIQQMKIENALLRQEDIPALDDLGFDAISNDDHLLPLPLSPVIITDPESDKALMIEIANTAMEELVRLLSSNDPFWFRSVVDGKFILQRATYEKIFHRGNHLKGPLARIESSKDSQIVNIEATQLVDMLLNSDKWVDLFSTIVTKAQTIHVFESGLSGSRDGALQLMDAHLHILSPLLPTREFVFLRYCKQVEEGMWVVVDVSCDSSSQYGATPTHTWRFPSGCLIQKISDGSCRVSWLEHVEVDEEIPIDHLFREVIRSKNPYGAEKWLFTLERTCERFSCSTTRENILAYDIEGVIEIPEGRRSVMRLGYRMLKSFFGTLDMSSNMDIPTDLTRLSNGIFRISARLSTEPGVAKGMIVSAAISFWLPLSPQNVFDFLKDGNKRTQWDALSYGNQMREIQRISNRDHPGNCTSIFKPLFPEGSNMLILQESYTDPLGSLVVFAPLDLSTLNFAMKGEDSSMFPLLPSGFSITGDGRSNVGNLGGSLVTIGYQILSCNPTETGQPEKDSIDAVTSLIASTVDKVKIALHCSNLD